MAEGFAGLPYDQQASSVPGKAADLSSLTADQLAEKVRLHVVVLMHTHRLGREDDAHTAFEALAELQTRANQRDEALREVEELGQRMYEETVPKNEANERIAHEQEQMRKLCNDQRAEDLARAEAAEKERDEAVKAANVLIETGSENFRRAEAAEARLAETQKALEAERHRAVEAETRLIRALTTHPDPNHTT